MVGIIIIIVCSRDTAKIIEDFPFDIATILGDFPFESYNHRRFPI